MVVYAPGILGDLAKTRLLIPCGAVCIGRAPPRIVYAQVLLDCIIQFLAEDLGIAPLQILDSLKRPILGPEIDHSRSISSLDTHWIEWNHVAH